MLGIIVVQIARVRELSAEIKGSERTERQGIDRTGKGLLVFMIVFLVLTIGSAVYYKNYILGYGPLQSASAHGGSIDSMIHQTLLVTGIAFILTHIALFYFAYRYRRTKHKRSTFISHDNRLEVVWTLIPAIVMTYLVVGGLDAWNEVMADVPEGSLAGEDYIEIEATGYQFAWDIRYPGPDGLLGTRDFRKISANNALGQDWGDTKNHDDFKPTEIVLPVGVPVRVRITSKDVLHDFYLPHFTVKMDAIPGMPTYFVFMPEVTTDSMRLALKEYPEYAALTDPEDPESGPRWQNFEYELACAELCGKGHYSMRKLVKIVSVEEYRDWLGEQKSYYMESVRNTDDDPFKGQPVNVELSAQKETLTNDMRNAMSAVDSAGRVVRLENVSYETGSAALAPVSQYELDNVVEILQQYPDVRVEIAGHTDNVGDPQANQALSQSRAEAVAAFLADKGIASDRLTGVNGYGDTRPAGDNATEDGRASNRRTEFIIAVSPES